MNVSWTWTSQTLHPSVPAGERLYVQRLMRKLFNKPDIIQFETNLTRTVWNLFPEKLVEKNGKQVMDTDSEPGEETLYHATVDTLDIPEKFNPRQEAGEESFWKFIWRE